jgi:hypothetical protein
VARSAHSRHQSTKHPMGYETHTQAADMYRHVSRYHFTLVTYRKHLGCFQRVTAVTVQWYDTWQMETNYVLANAEQGNTYPKLQTSCTRQGETNATWKLRFRWETRLTVLQSCSCCGSAGASVLQCCKYASSNATHRVVNSSYTTSSRVAKVCVGCMITLLCRVLIIDIHS